MFHIKIYPKAIEMAHQVKVPTAKADNLSLIPRTCVGRRGTMPKSCVLTSTHVS